MLLLCYIKHINLLLLTALIELTRPASCISTYGQYRGIIKVHFLSSDE